jgi:hypothetical protein
MTHPNHHRRKYQNILIFLVSIVGVILFSYSPLFPVFFTFIQHFPIIAAFLAGIFFASTFTVAIGGLIIVNLATSLNPLILILFSSLGAISFDLFIFLFFKHHITRGVSEIYKQIDHHSHLKKIVHTKYFAWTLPVIGAFIIASPLPDELGVSLLGLSNTSLTRFLLISSICHTIGISSIVGGSRAI